MIMIKVLSKNERYPSPCALLLGGFDGLHIGHGTLVQAAKAYHVPIGITSICGAKKGGDLFTYPEREYIYEQAGVSFVYEIPFTEEVKNTPPKDFAEDLYRRFSLKAILCGSDFRFGKQAMGTPSLLKETAPCGVEVLELKKLNGEKISSTTVKRYLSEGSMSEVNALLCGGYFIMGRVEHGRRVGRTIGFPTVNISYPAEKFPIREGVYGGVAETEKGTYPAIVNFGARPTFSVNEYKVEAYLDGFEGDLYGTTLRIYPREFYRPVRQFGSVDELKEQLKSDILRLRRREERK